MQNIIRAGSLYKALLRLNNGSIYSNIKYTELKVS